MFQGTQTNSGNSAAIPADDKVKAAGPILKAKILNYLNRSVLAANFFPQTLQVIFEGNYLSQSIFLSTSE